MYFDTNIFIYLLEGNENFQNALSDLDELMANEAIKVTSCDLVYTEIHAGVLRGETGIKTPDALHVASTIQNDADIFLTNDTGIHTPESIRRVLLSDYSDSQQ